MSEYRGQIPWPTTTPRRSRGWTHHRRVGRTVIRDAGERLDDRAALHLMIVAADHRFLGADIERGEQLQQVAGVIVLDRNGRLPVVGGSHFAGSCMGGSPRA